LQQIRKGVIEMAGYTCLWEFIVKTDHVEEFRQRYGPSGPWVALFRRAPGYLDTLLLGIVPIPHASSPSTAGQVPRRIARFIPHSQ